MFMLGGYLPHTTEPTPLEVEYLVAAGGGSGGVCNTSGFGKGGGGGAGGLRRSEVDGPLRLQPGTSYAITVGAGGKAGQAFSNFVSAGDNGQNSSIGSLVVSVGGGKGCDVSGQFGGPATSGGSGGGGSNNDTASGNGTPGQGFSGSNGSSFQSSSNTGSAGNGGGAGGPGSSGGPGVTSSITGTAYTYCQGGKGGGNSGDSSTNYGCGGGGTQAGASGSGAGQNGIVVIRYLGTTQKANGGTVTFITDPNNGQAYVVHTFTSSGAFEVNP